MAYLFKKKFDIRELVNLDERPRRVFVVEPDHDLLLIYGGYLQDHGFEVELGKNEDFLIQRLKSQKPHLLLINAELLYQSQHLKRVLGVLAQEMSMFLVVSVGYDLSYEQVKEIMSIGAVSHVDRRFSRPHDVIMLIKSLLKHNH